VSARFHHNDGRSKPIRTPSTVKSSQKIFFSIRENLTTDGIAMIARDWENANLTTENTDRTDRNQKGEVLVK
jgi:hypothetical protein